MLTANLICKKQCRSLSRKHNFNKRSTNMHILQDKPRCQKYKVSDTAFAKLIPAIFVVLIATKFISQNLSKFNDEIF